MIPSLNDSLNEDNLKFLHAFATSCRRMIIEMITNAKSGHPGGSLSSIDYLTLLYTFIISQTGEKVVISNGHISPAVYSVLANLGYISKSDLINTFRKKGPFQGHVSRSVRGVEYGTGPLGIGISAALGFSLSNKLNNSSQKVFALLGDGEAEEGQVYEMMNMASKYSSKLIVFLDHNHVQLSDSTENIMPIDTANIFKAGGWEVIETDGHDFNKMWTALQKASISQKPVLIDAATVMGKGVGFMEREGLAHRSTWHGSAPSTEECERALIQLKTDDADISLIESFKSNVKWNPAQNFTESLAYKNINTGLPIVYQKDELTDCRSAYGKALLSLAKLNPEIIAMSADLKKSVKTDYLINEMPDRHLECGIAEQNMVSAAGAISLTNYIPFVSSFGAFISSRAKDQARVNDINRCNVKMVATHCGLSVGEDGPTHQSLDDAGSMLGMFNTMIIEPSDPNHTDRIIRYIASHYGNFFIKMGRAKLPVITDEQGNVFYDEKYIYEYGKTDIIREGSDITIAATGPMINEALKAQELLKGKVSIEIICVSSIKKFDENIFNSIKKTSKLLTAEDHNTFSGLGSQLAREILKRKISLDIFEMIGVEEYQMSDTVEELYKNAGIDNNTISQKIINLLKL